MTQSGLQMTVKFLVYDFLARLKGRAAAVRHDAAKMAKRVAIEWLRMGTIQR